MVGEYGPCFCWLLDKIEFGLGLFGMMDGGDALNSPFVIARLISTRLAEPHSSVGSVADLRTGGRWFDPRLGQYSFRGLMIVIATGFIPLSPLSVVSTMVVWESSQWLGNNIVQSTG